MKPGDKVKCVRATAWLRHGAIYTVDAILQDGLLNFEEISGDWRPSRFELVSEQPEPSKEALEIAKCLGLDDDQIHSVAWELQKLMDERDRAERELDLAMKECDRQTSRAEAAEKEAKRWEAHARSLEAPLQDWRQRAEAAEKDAAKTAAMARNLLDLATQRAEAAVRNVQTWIERTNEANARAEAAEKALANAEVEKTDARWRAAEARLAEFVRKVRECEESFEYRSYRLLDILDEYEAAK